MSSDDMDERMAPPMETITSEYTWRKTEDGDNVTCSSCNCEAPEIKIAYAPPEIFTLLEKIHENTTN